MIVLAKAAKFLEKDYLEREGTGMFSVGYDFGSHRFNFAIMYPTHVSDILSKFNRLIQLT